MEDFLKKMENDEFKNKFTELSKEIQDMVGDTIHIKIGDEQEQQATQESSVGESIYWTRHGSIIAENLEHNFSVIDREIYITNDVNAYTPEEIDLKIKTICFLTDDYINPIKLIINNYGGDVYALMAIYDTIRLSETPIHTFTKGCAMSAGALLLCFGKHRVMTKNSSIMLHDYSGGLHGTTKDWLTNTKHMEKIQDNMYHLLGKHTKKDFKWWKNKLQRDLYLDADECLKLGIVDEII
jgi:ATP-dependent Clp protease, protease subunit